MNLNVHAKEGQTQLRRWQIGMLTLALVGEVFLAADWYAFAAVISFVSETLHLDPAEAGFAQGIFALAYAFGMLAWSQVTTRMSARSMLLMGLVGTGVGMVLQTFVQSYVELIALRLLIGVFDAAIFLGNMKLIFGWFPQSRRASVVGLVLAAYSLAITLDFALGIPLSIAFGWRTFFGALAAGTLITGLANWLFVKNDPTEIGHPGFASEGTETTSSLAAFRLLVSQRWVFVTAVGISAAVAAIAGTATWVVPAYVKFQQVPVEIAGLIGMAMGLSQVAFLIVGGYISDRVRKTVVIRIGAVLGLVSALLFTVSTVYPMSLASLFVIAGLSGMCVLSGGAIFSLLSEKYSPALATAAVGYAEIFGMIANFLSPWMMGLFLNATNGSFTHAFLAFSALQVVFVVVLLVLAREASSAKSAIVVRDSAIAN